MLQLICHGIGDYLLQSDWMASNKVSRTGPALAHVLTYTLPFLLITRSPVALAFICVTHFIIDRWRLARYVCWAKNFLAPWPKYVTDPTTDPPSRRTLSDVVWWHPWSECSGTGYHKDRPAWMAVWLLIIADNTMHLACNALALHLWP